MATVQQLIYVTVDVEVVADHDTQYTEYHRELAEKSELVAAKLAAAVPGVVRTHVYVPGEEYNADIDEWAE